eukprot:TRINITY_DN9823_c0_g1_i5.p1 TRINITY_DN9823_c0_g1~~TRINITY_DN9823_c0_g1_i5.p1  ORF type:complete len:563 (-),score=62.99 TRINITY_DN9823_c0_g1_i5:77-1765(-)
MPNKRSYRMLEPTAWDERQLRRAARDWYYQSAHSGPNMKFVECPRSQAAEIRSMVKSKQVHSARNKLIGYTCNAARTTSLWAVRMGLIDEITLARDLDIHRQANRAKHGDASFTALPTNNESGCRHVVSHAPSLRASTKDAWADISDTASSSRSSPEQDAARASLMLATTSIKTPGSVSPSSTACYQRNPALHFGSLPDNWEDVETAPYFDGPPLESGDEEKPSVAGLVQSTELDISDLHRQLQDFKGLTEALLTRNSELLSQVNYLQCELLWSRSYLAFSGQLEESSLLTLKADISEGPMHECTDAHTAQTTESSNYVCPSGHASYHNQEPETGDNADLTWLIGDLAQRTAILEAQNSAQTAAVASIFSDSCSMFDAKCESVKRAIIDELEPLLQNIKGYIREELNRSQASFASSPRTENHDDLYVDEVHPNQTPGLIVPTSEVLLPETEPRTDDSVSPVQSDTSLSSTQRLILASPETVDGIMKLVRSYFRNQVASRRSKFSYVQALAADDSRSNVRARESFPQRWKAPDHYSSHDFHLPTGGSLPGIKPRAGHISSIAP